MPVVLTFDVPVKNKREFEKNLQVTSSPAQPGTWRWFSDTQVRYRPEELLEAGHQGHASQANLNGVNAGSGVYGQNSATTSFTVGRSFKIRVNLRSDVAKVYKNGKKVRTIYVSGGKPGWQTRSGIKLIMAKEYNKKMTNEAIGAKEDYTLIARHALRITNSGEFLHSAPWNTAHFGRRNASHGCTGMSNGERRLALQPHPDRRPGDHHRHQPAASRTATATPTGTCPTSSTRRAPRSSALTRPRRNRRCVRILR